MFERLQEAAGGLFKLVDLAPEEEGAMEFIRAEKGKVVLSIAHTTADYENSKSSDRSRCHSYDTSVQCDEPDQSPRAGTDHRGSR